MRSKKPVLLITAFLAFSSGLVGCNDNSGGDTIDANHVHNYALKVVNDTYLASEATCGAAAKYYYSCECGAKGTQTFVQGQKGEHKFDTSHWHYDDYEHWHEATCGHDLKEDEGKHVFDQCIANEQTKAVDANCERGALYYMSCVCGKIGTGVFECGPLGDHEFEEDYWIYDSTGHWHDTNCPHSVKKDFEKHTMEFDHVVRFDEDQSVYKCEKCGYTETRTREMMQILDIVIEHDFKAITDITSSSTVRITLKTNLGEDVQLKTNAGSADISVTTYFTKTKLKEPTCTEDGAEGYRIKSTTTGVNLIRYGMRIDDNYRIGLGNCKDLATELINSGRLDITFPLHTEGHDIKAVAAETSSCCQGQGLKAHYECTKCHKCFSDADGKNEVSRKSLENTNDFIFFVKDSYYISGKGALVYGELRSEGINIGGRVFYYYGANGYNFTDAITGVYTGDSFEEIVKRGASYKELSSSEELNLKIGDMVAIMLRNYNSPGHPVAIGSYVSTSNSFASCMECDTVDYTTGICEKCGKFIGVENISNYYDLYAESYSYCYELTDKYYKVYFKTAPVPMCHQMFIDYLNISEFTKGYAYSDCDVDFNFGTDELWAERKYSGDAEKLAPITFVFEYDSTSSLGVEYFDCECSEDNLTPSDNWKCEYCGYSGYSSLSIPNWTIGNPASSTNSSGIHSFAFTNAGAAYACLLTIETEGQIVIDKSLGTGQTEMELYLGSQLIGYAAKSSSTFTTPVLPVGKYMLRFVSDFAQSNMSDTNIGKSIKFAYGYKA